jgi:hypothetical protein
MRSFVELVFVGGIFLWLELLSEVLAFQLTRTKVWRLQTEAVSQRPMPSRGVVPTGSHGASRASFSDAMHALE